MFTKMIKIFSVFLCFLLGKEVISMEFDFITEYQIVRTKIHDEHGGKVRLHLSDSDSGDLIFSVVLSQLSRNASVFSSALTTFTVHNSSGTFQIPNEILYYHGYIDSENTTSHLHGTLYHNQGFEGVIHLEHKTFYLEAVDRHKRMSRKDLSLMYETDDLTELTEGMFTFKDLPPDMSLHNHSDEFSNEHHWRINDKHLHNKYGVPKPHMAHHTRTRRQTSTEVNYCTLHIVVDGYYTHFMGNDDKHETAKLISQYVQTVHEIYLSHDFDGNGKPDNVGVIIVALTFIDKIFGFNYIQEDKSPEEFLTTFTNNYQFPDICYANIFTFQNFKSTLGMAWVARSSSPRRTGVGAVKNHGYCTTLLKGKRVPLRVAQLTFAHELGHSFGSSHDPQAIGTQCAPLDAQGGRFIMYPMTSQGNMPNNFLFSPCSKNVIAIIIGTRGETVLKRYMAPYCGNGHIEEGEMCDCGTPLSCKDLDQCCIPAGHPNECMLRVDQGAVCSPTVHDCCTSGCQTELRRSEGDTPCRGFTECFEPSYCDGEHWECPTPVIKPNGTLCQGETRFCESGECKKSICEIAGLVDCQCLDPYNACKFCCSDDVDAKNGLTSAASCKPATEYKWFDENGLTVAVMLQPGSLCMDYTGYCNEDYLCQKPGLDYITLLGFSEVTKNVSYWFDSNWYSLMVVLFLSISLFLVFICSQEIPKTDISTAFRAGNISRVVEECHRQSRVLNDEITELNKEVHLYEAGQCGINTALARLTLLFPLTPTHQIYHVIANSANEATAVKKILLMKQPMRKDVNTDKGLRAPTKKAETVGKDNEQFSGDLVATVKDMVNLTKAQRKVLGIADPTEEQAIKMIQERRHKFLSGVAKIFNKKMNH